VATFTKYNIFAEDLANKVHDLFGTTDTLKVALTNTAPNASTHAVRADITELSTGNGYTSGGADVQNDSTRTGAVVTVTATDVVWTASGGSIGPFRYVVLYNDTPTSPADPLIGYYDYGSSITVLTGETFTADFGASLLTITVT
jgi:hypothetical protein